MKSNPESNSTIPLPERGVIPHHIPRGLEVLIKKAAVDPTFKDILFEKRAGAAQAIGLKITAAEQAMLTAVPLPHLEGIIAHTRVAPKLRPAFLGYAAGAMLAALGTATLLSDSEITHKGQPNAGAASFSKKRAKANERFTGVVRSGDSGGWPYALGGAVGRGGGTGMRGDWPAAGPPKTGPKPRRKSPGHRVVMGMRADLPEASGSEQPVPYIITFDSQASGSRNYRSASAIRDYVKKRLAGIRNAYDAAAEENPALGGGKITARFTVDARGRVVKADIAEDTLGEESLRRSILSRVRSWKFPAAGQADVVVEYPFVFIAEKG